MIRERLLWQSFSQVPLEKQLCVLVLPLLVPGSLQEVQGDHTTVTGDPRATSWSTL